MKSYKEHKILLSSVYGSHNYGLVTETSDTDYKIFVLPTLDDLLNNKMINDTFKKDGNDYEVKDIRLLVGLLEKANPSYIEIMFSNELSGNKELVKFLKENRQTILKENLISFMKAVIGMTKEKKHAIIKNLPNEETNEGFKRKQKFGYDTKQLVHSIRLLKIVELLSETGNLQYWIEDEKLRKELKSLKDNGTFFGRKIDKESAIKIIEDNIEDIKMYEPKILKELSINNKNKNNELKKLVFKIIKKDLTLFK